nr:hypothetical protein [Tanacetum cinerariifolium]
MEEYLTLTLGNQASGVVKPEIGSNVNFKIKSQFIRELREDTFFGNKNDDAHEHVERVLDIVRFFNIPKVLHDVVMLRVFPMTLTRTAKRWVDRLPPGTVDPWDLLNKAFIQRYFPPSKTAKQLEKIRNFKRKETRLYSKPGNGIMNYYRNASPMILIAIRRNTEGSSNSEGIAAILNKIENLSRDMKKLKENVRAIQVGCQICGRAYLEEVNSVEEVKYGEFSRPFPNKNKNDGRLNRGGYNQPSSGERRPTLTEIINKYIEKASKRHADQDERLKKFYQSTKTNREAHDRIIQGLETKVKTLANEVEGRVNNEKFKQMKDNLFFDNEKQETDNSGMTEALAALEATLKIKKEEPKEEKQSVNYYVDPYEPSIPFTR